MDITLDGEWDRQELNSALNLAERRPLVLLILGVFLTTPIVGLAIAGVVSWPAAAVGGVLASGVMTFTFRRNRRQQLDAPIVQGRVTGQITDQFVTLTTAQGQAVNSWATATKYVANDDAVIVRQGGAAGFMVLRNWFPSESDWQRFRQSVDQLIASPAPGPGAIAPRTGAVTPTGDAKAIAYGGELNASELSGLYRQVRALRWGARVALVAATLGLAGGVASALGAGSLPATFRPLVASVALLVLALGVAAIPRLLAASVIRKAPVTTISGQASSLGLQQTGLARGSANLRWSAFASASISDDGVSLHLHENGPFVPVLRSWFDEQENWDRFVALVDEQVRT